MAAAILYAAKAPARFSSAPEGHDSTHISLAAAYMDLVCVVGKNAISLVGEDSQGTVIAYANNNSFNQQIIGSHVIHRGVFVAAGCDDLTNREPTTATHITRGGSQAESLILSATQQPREISNVDSLPYQDTRFKSTGMRTSRLPHRRRCSDFHLGPWACFFSRNALAHPQREAGVFTRRFATAPANHGYVFHTCTFDWAGGGSGCGFRPNRAGRCFRAAKWCCSNCTLGESVNPSGWLFSGAKEPDTSKIHFWESKSE